MDDSYFGGVDDGGKIGLGLNKQTVMVSVEVEQCKINMEMQSYMPGKSRFKLISNEIVKELYLLYRAQLKKELLYMQIRKQALVYLVKKSKIWMEISYIEVMENL